MNPPIHEFFDDVEFDNVVDSKTTLRIQAWNQGRMFAFGNEENITFLSNCWHHCQRKNFNVVQFGIIQDTYQDNYSDEWYFGKGMGYIKFRREEYDKWAENYTEIMSQFFSFQKEKTLVYHFLRGSTDQEILDIIDEAWAHEFQAPDAALIKIVKTG